MECAGQFFHFASGSQATFFNMVYNRCHSDFVREKIIWEWGRFRKTYGPPPIPTPIESAWVSNLA